MTKFTSQPLLHGLAALSREKADALMLVLSCAFILIPFVEYSVAWISTAAVLLIGWRVLITVRGQRLPERWLVTLIAVALVIGVCLHFHTWLGKDVGIAFLIILISAKLLELHARRDAVAVIFLCYFLLVGQLLYSQSILSALYLIFCAGLLISAQFSIQYHQLIPPLSKRLLSGYKIVGMAVPLALILFLFFPRIQGPLWGKPQGNAGGITGLSESMEPGNVAELALSDQIAFRVRFHQAVPDQALLYWRGIVLDTFNGSRWSVSASHNKFEAGTAAPGMAVSQEIFLEPHGQRWLFGLDQPVYLSNYNGMALSQTDRQFGQLTRYDEMRSPSPIQDRIKYTIVSNIVDPAAAVAGVTMPMSLSEKMELLNYALQLPVGYNPLTIQWAQQLRQRSNDPVQLSNLVLLYFRVQPFRYTLDPPPLGNNQVDDFMFTTRAGFCEHYASAFVVIMRAMHIPARVVTGYQGGEINPMDHLMTVRQSDAHAWAEIWTDQRGWIRIDPTAAVAPNRVERGINASFPNRNLAGLLNISQQSWIAGVARQLRLQWDATNSAWNLWVLNYSMGKQLDLLSFITGIEYPQPAQLGMAMMIAASLVMAVLTLIMLGKRSTVSPLDRIYQNFCSHMRRQGCARMPHEGAEDYGRRLLQIFPEAVAITDFLNCYNDCKYGKGYNSGQLNTLKKLLALCLQLKSARTPSISSAT